MTLRAAAGRGKPNEPAHSRAGGPSKRQHQSSTRRTDLGRWSARVTRESNALDLEAGVFRNASALEVAQSLKRSAEQSKRRKAGAFASAMSMLVFYINRAGRNLPDGQRRILEEAKGELRRLFGRPPG